jgi:hypothetical protein
MVEVAGIEPASKDKSKAKSTCLAIFNLTFPMGNSQTKLESQPKSFRTTL